ncbi:phosphotransferase [Ornithinibacillus salinisoli]|uniref:Phosphotransferase n=1 Tax=Ornithinibacillus salinisoli TaxID=1848459 RepID=A0ABW4W4H0_9BACI
MVLNFGGDNRVETVRNVLQSYGVYPVEIESITNRLYKITDMNHYQYALKKSQLTQETVAFWEQVLHIANENKLPSIVPVYLTRQGNFYHELEGQLFYLTPWFEEVDDSLVTEKLYQAIGHIHHSTKKVQPISTESIISSFHRYKQELETVQSTHLSYVEQFEQKRYMSPFELLVCTQYQILEKVFFKLNWRLEQLIVELTDTESWSVSLCHGDLCSEHVIQANQILFLNWEKAYVDNAIFDLVTFYKAKVVPYDVSVDNLIDSFVTYTKENELQKSELFLLAIYLMDPAEYMELIQVYQENPNVSMMEQVKHLQQANRRLVFALQFSDYVESEYESLDLDEFES